MPLPPLSPGMVWRWFEDKLTGDIVLMFGYPGNGSWIERSRASKIDAQHMLMQVELVLNGRTPEQETNEKPS